ncbi:MAG TPA: N-acetylmuramoyl-L-alanine amidase, partial [Chitinophagaceae bacterium]
AAASFHWLVPDEDEPQHGQLIWACVRERDAAWHVRNSRHHPDVNDDETRVNHWSLGIEVVNRQSGGDSFSEWQVAVTAQIIRYCWAKYPNLQHIVSHAKLDPDRRSDPGVNFPWERFKELVLDVSREPLSTIPPPADFSMDHPVLRGRKNASLEQEEANFEIEDEAEKRLHETSSDRINF